MRFIYVVSYKTFCFLSYPEDSEIGNVYFVHINNVLIFTNMNKKYCVEIY